MTVLLNQSGQIVVNRSGQVISCDTVPEVCGSSSWQVVMNVESGAVDPEYESILVKLNFGMVLGSGQCPITGGAVEILEQTNCYVIDRLGGIVVPEPEEGASPGWGYEPFTVVYSWGHVGNYIIKPWNEIAPWSAAVRAVVTFDRVVTLCEMEELYQLNVTDGSLKFPDLKFTYTLKPIQLTGAEDGEDNEI